MITITLEGECWQDILDEMAIIQECARRASSAPRIEAKAEQTNIANPCRKCRDDRHNKLMGILESGYGLGPEEVAEILERVR